MFCHKCGSPNPDNALSCASCGATFANPYQSPTGGATPINNWLIPAIFSTLCCCVPFGIVSIVYAAQVNGLLASGDINGAKRAADNARMWFWIAVAPGLLFWLGYLGLLIIGGLSGLNEGQFR
jgi:hypothetical protein